MSELIIPIKQYARTAAQLASDNPILVARQLVIESDTGKMKLGNGTTAYNSLPYLLVSGTTSQYVRGDGSLATFPSIPSITGLVPYTGANANVNLGTNTITANQLIKSGGTSSQFLKADGSIDSTVYYPNSNPSGFITSAALSGYIQGSGTTNYIPRFTASGTIGNGIIQDNGSKISIGGTVDAANSVAIKSSIGGATAASGINQSGRVLSSVTSSGAGFTNVVTTEDASFTLPDYYHFQTIQGVLGVGSSITRQYGFFVPSTMTGAGTNYGFYGGINTGAGVRYNLYMFGSAPNLLVGRTQIGSSNDDGVTMLQVRGNTLINNDTSFSATTVNIAVQANDNGTGWDLTRDFAQYQLRSQDGSGAGVGVRASIGAVMETTNGSDTAMTFRMAALAEAGRITAGRLWLINTTTSTGERFQVNGTGKLVTSLGIYGATSGSALLSTDATATTLTINKPTVATSFAITGGLASQVLRGNGTTTTGVSGSFTTVDGKTITVTSGVITAIV